MASPSSRSGKLRQQRAQSAGEIEILHEKTARRPKIGQARSAARNRIETFEGQRDARRGQPWPRDARWHWSSRPPPCPPRWRCQRLSALRKREGFRSAQTFSTICRPAFGSHAPVRGVAGRDGRGAGQGQAERLRDGRHRARGAHGHAMPVRAGDALLHFAPFLLGEIARRAFPPSTSTHPTPSRASGRASCRAASARRARR